MGVPKQKWTLAEEAALKAGILKHGSGKWRTILKDPEFSGVLCLRSNVDLKDKWRNMGVTANGYGSRNRSRFALKKSQLVLNTDDNPLAFGRVVKSDEEIVDAKPLAVASEALPIAGPKKSIARLDSLIIEAIASLREPSGSDRTSIAMYIEDQFCVPPNFKRVLSAKLKLLTACGRLSKVKRKYRIEPRSGFSEGRKISGMLLLEGRQSDSPVIDNNGARIFTKLQVNAELERMRNMTAQQAAAAAAQAIAEAEGAIAEAELAEMEAEAAEADAEAAQAFAEAALMTLKARNALVVLA